MKITITSEGEASFPEGVLEKLGLRPGDEMELEERAEGYILRARSGGAARTPPSRGRTPPELPSVDIAERREQP